MSRVKVIFDGFPFQSSMTRREKKLQSFLIWMSVKSGKVIFSESGDNALTVLIRSYTFVIYQSAPVTFRGIKFWKHWIMRILLSATQPQSIASCIQIAFCRVVAAAAAAALS